MSGARTDIDAGRVVEAMERALAAARDAGADDVEIAYEGADTHFARFAGSRFTQVGATVGHQLRVRVLAGGHLGSAVAESLDAARVATAVSAALAAARSAPPLDVPLAFATPDDAGEELAAAPGPTALPPAWTAEGAVAALGGAFDVHRGAGVRFAGAAKSYHRVSAVRTAAGVLRDHETALVDLQAIALCGDGSGFAGSFGPATEEIDTAGVLSRAADIARRAENPLTLDPGAYDVVLAPEALAELLEWMAIASFGAAPVLDGTSALAGREGQPLLDRRVTLAEAPHPTVAPFDPEGTARADLAYIDAGVAGGCARDRVFALRLGDGRPSTGHAASIAESAFGGTPQSMHVSMAAGDTPEAELVAAIERGVYVTRFHYVNGLLDTRRGTSTGMTRDGAFLIENGVPTRGIANLRFTDHMVEILGERLAGIGSERRAVPSWWSDGRVLTVPAVAIRGFHFTGQSR